MISGVSDTKVAGVAVPVEARTEIYREAVTMVLYVSVVEIAELAALPEEHFTRGLSAARWARSSSPSSGGPPSGSPSPTGSRSVWRHRRSGGNGRAVTTPTSDSRQVAGAIFVAAVSSVPVLLLPDVQAQETTGDVPAILIGLVGYLLARYLGKSTMGLGALRRDGPRPRRARRAGEVDPRRPLTRAGSIRRIRTLSSVPVLVAGAECP